MRFPVEMIAVIGSTHAIVRYLCNIAILVRRQTRILFRRIAIFEFFPGKRSCSESTDYSSTRRRKRMRPVTVYSHNIIIRPR